MGSNSNKFFFYFNKDDIKTLIEKYGTDVKEDLLKAIKADILSKKEQAANTDAETKQWKLRKLKAETLIKEHELTYIETFNDKPSPEAKSAIRQLAEHHAKQQSVNIVQADGSLKCITCGVLFRPRAYEFQQADDYQTHIKIVHQRGLYIESEKPIIAKMLGVTNG